MAGKYPKIVTRQQFSVQLHFSILCGKRQGEFCNRYFVLRREIPW